MNSKSQRVRISERGWSNYTGYFGGVEFKNGLSVELVDPAQMTRLGAIVSLTMVDTDEQAGVAANLVRTHFDKAEVVKESPRGVQPSVAPAEVHETPKYTREFLESEADKNGIAGLRAIGDTLGVRGRGINELIEAILAAQVA